MTIRYSSAVVRRAIVSSVNYEDGVLQTRWLDDDSVGPIVPIPHPAPNKGGSGIYVGIRVGAIILLALGAYRTYVPVAILPTMVYYSEDPSSMPEADYDDLSFPFLESGDVVIQGQTGARLRLNNNNNIEEIILDNEFGEGTVIGGGTDSFRCSIDTSSPVRYTIAPSGIKASGIVRRDVKIEDVEESFVDFLSSLESEQSLEEIGWDPSRQVTYISGSMAETTKSQMSDKIYRNPAFIEERQTIYEFGRNWNVGTLNEEKDRLKNTITPIPDAENRTERRSNVLNLSLSNPNELIEKIGGTVVDIFGNMIDINRKILNTPEGDDSDKLLENILEQTRHTIAYHMEINTRKGWRFDESTQTPKNPSLFTDPVDVMDSIANNSRDRSRWFIDVDKEGLTKINIPASSETGNVPMIARYENSSVLDIGSDGNPTVEGRQAEDTRKIFRNEKNRDIFTEQVGPGGIKIVGNIPDNRMGGKKTSWIESDGALTPSSTVSQKVMSQDVEAGTAFHNITKTAWALIKENINKSASDIIFNGPTSTESGLRAISEEVNSQTPSTGNAGGRSTHINMDGSMEVSVGANTVDRVSWIMDTAGALIWRLGRDKSGRSAVIHADGTVALEIGGFDYVGESSSDGVDTRFAGGGRTRNQVLDLDPHQFRSGKLVLRIRRSTTNNSGPEPDDTLVIVDETGVTVNTPGRLDLISGQDMSLTSKSRIILDAPKVQVYKQNPKYFARTARLIK